MPQPIRAVFARTGAVEDFVELPVEGERPWPGAWPQDGAYGIPGGPPGAGPVGGAGSGAWWLIPGPLLAAAGIASLAAALPLGPALAGTGIGIVAAAAIATVVVAFAVRRPVVRNRVLAAPMALMALVSIVLLVILLGAGTR